jgi:hypothetical protein
MSYRPDEKDWMAYLYGEMDEAKKRKFDQYILGNPEAREELEKFGNIRKTLSFAGDKEVIAPPIVIGERPSHSQASGRQHFWQMPYVRAIASVAASIILVILVGKLTGTQLVVAEKQVKLSFGSPESVPASEPAMPASLTKDEVRQMIENSLAQNNVRMEANLAKTQEQLDASIRRNLALSSGKIDDLLRESSSASQEQIRQFVDGIRAENMRQVKDYFQLSSTEQKKYIENLLVDFAKYLQQQRNDDLQLMQTRLNSLEQNTDLFKQETEQILTSIITTVGTPPVTGETRN